ncbi:hypothetical protein [Cryptosporangium phraense]|uniref:Uncharacterized protein n=1 Tax=Cryptosporangium phraense TaxID=2593070 RepID=A0A545AWL4_9ACTN|nr:hypothetical protein [Cryptosporangium phraense]TQS45723.1 hypothetical protein FL583_08395 [Cryptosporangium phraense]
MFVLVWGPRSDDSDLRGQELHGIEYASALNKLLPAVVDAQSNAVQGKQVAKGGFSEGLDAVAAADEKYGADFGTSNRWSGLRARIETLPEQGAGDAEGAFRSYGEVTDLLLALYAQVAQASGLRHDGDRVINFIQDAGLEEIPSAIVWAGRFQDQAYISKDLPDPSRTSDDATFKAQQDQLNESLTAMAVSRQITGESGADVAADMASAVDASGSGTFDTDLLQSLDAFQRGIESVAPPGQEAITAKPDPKSVASLRSSAQNAAGSLNPLLLGELRSQVEDRKSSSDAGRLLGAAVAAIAVLALLASILMGLLGRRRSRPVDAPSDYRGAPNEPVDYPAYPTGEPMGPDSYLNNLDAGRDARRERIGVPR